MQMSVAYWDRRDGADRVSMAQAAFELCRAQRAMAEVEDSRFYWTGPDQVVVQVRLSEPVDWAQPEPGVAKSLFALADQARQTRTENWMDPATGEDNYRRAGRSS